MHVETFALAFGIFVVVGLVLPVLLAGLADRGRILAEQAPDAPSEPSVYEQIGGAAAVDAAVDIFYRRVLADAYVNRFFEGVDMEKQAAKQKAFLTMVMGGPNKYTGKDMREGHKHLLKMGLNDTHFDHILMHLRATLAELGVPDRLIQTIAAVAESTRDDVLNR
ncbi:MAG: group 1 truncated hemoglobin [Zetaproteobacteria bacterium]|nr:MAG: group 1 truncated hemoglobin [Zetaproteobacteria bacterium]